MLLWQSMGSAGVAVKEVHLCASLAPFLGGFSTIVHMMSLRGALRLWSKMRSSASASSKISSAWLIHPPRLATPHAQIFYLRPRSGSICCANARNLGSYISLSAPTHVLPCFPCKADFHSCSTVWILFANPAQALGSLPGAWPSSLATWGTLGTVLFLSMVPLRAPELKYSVPLVFAMWSSEALVHRTLLYCFLAAV